MYGEDENELENESSYDASMDQIAKENAARQKMRDDTRRIIMLVSILWNEGMPLEHAKTFAQKVVEGRIAHLKSI